MNAIDTNVLIYAIDEIDPVKHGQAIELLSRLAAEPAPPVLLWQVACEFLCGLRRRQNAGRVSAADVQRVMDEVLAAFPLLTPLPTVIEKACELYEGYSLSHWDSLLIAACVCAGVDTLYSEDMSDGMSYDSVAVINPFKSTH